jgi:hypothetical protein
MERLGGDIFIKCSTESGSRGLPVIGNIQEVTSPEKREKQRYCRKEGRRRKVREERNEDTKEAEPTWRFP